MARVATDDAKEAIEKLSAGQTVTYKLAETFGGEFAVIQLNPEGGGKKYMMTLEEAQAGKPTGKKRVFMRHDNPTFIAKWIHQFWGEPVKS